MKKTIKIMAVVLGVASIMTVLSCKKENITPRPVETLRDATCLAGEWRCTWNKEMRDYDVQENEYVGAIWKIGTPLEYNAGQYIGEFKVEVNGVEHNGHGEFHYNNGAQNWLPQLGVWISEQDKFYCFHGYHESKPGDAYRLTCNYSIIMSENAMSLYQSDVIDSSFSDSKLVLKFTKVQ